MPTLITRAIKAGARLTIKHNPKTPEGLVRHLRLTMGNPPVPPILPRGARVEKLDEDGLRGDWIRVKKPGQVILYLHGGGYVCGKPKTYHNLCSRLAVALDADVCLPAYRLAPEHAFPAAVDDATTAYELLLKKGWMPRQITVMGDSAGAGLALGMLLSLRDAGRPMPKCAVLYSPYADVTMASPSRRYNDASDAMLSYRMLEVGMAQYVQNGDYENPYASPVYGEYSGLPPLLMTVCEEEIFRDDTYRVAEKARAAGVEVVILSRPDTLHVWPVFVPVMPEAREDFQKTVRFIASAGR
ncbi:MAG: alpha/beta hydrolase [Moraxellaceae bacterium]|nr:alpha/beta hydrolase [Moraxellaceae bacterium]